MEDRPTKIIAAPGEREIIITRLLDAPRDLVYKVITDPNLIPQWWGPAFLTTTVEKMDVRPGGSWRYVQRDPDGNEYGFHGEYREVVPPERIVQTFEFEGVPGESLETLILEEQDGKTLWRATSLYPSVEARDGALQSGMAEGIYETYDRLADVLARTASGGKAYVEREAA